MKLKYGLNGSAPNAPPNQSAADPWPLNFPCRLTSCLSRSVSTDSRPRTPRPLVSLGKRPGKIFTSFRVSPARAWSFPEVQYANAGSSYAALVFDCDSPERMGLGICDLPPSNWAARRIANGHAHPAWTLAKPVHRYPSARVAPLNYAAKIAEYFAHALGADPNYNGILAHNPAPKYRDGEFVTDWGRSKAYELDELASIIPFGWEPPTVRQTGIGRNVDLFEAGMTWAGRRANQHLPMLPALMAVNQEFAHPLPLSELQVMARSIEKYRARWAARGWHCPRWIARQSIRGKASGRARRAGSNEQRRPWEAEGISRRTWYRRRARERGTRTNTDKMGVALPLVGAFLP